MNVRDQYDISAQYYDLFMAAPRANTIPSADFFVAVGLLADHVLDVGAGSGRVSLPLARAGRYVCSLEPSRAMRAILLAKAAEEPGLWKYLTLLDGAAPSFVVAGSFDAVLVSGVLQHLSAADRGALFRTAAAHLRTGGWLATDMVGGTAPEHAAERCIGEVALGDVTYRCDLGVAPIDEGHAELTFRYRTYRNNVCLTDETTVRKRTFAPVRDVYTELEQAGFRVVPVSELPEEVGSVIPEDALVACRAR